MTTKIPAAEMTRKVKMALAERHAADFFITECKDGPTWFCPHMRVDALAIKKSWSPVRIIAYEVKVSRSDFLGDDKYLGYKDMCHELNLVCPKGLIDPKEVPEDVGLAYYYPDSGKVISKVKARYREVEINSGTLLYIIMNRLESDRYPFFSNKQAYFQEWLKNRKDDKQLGGKVGRALRERILRAQEAERKLARLEKDENEAIRQLREVNNMLRSHGINSWNVAQAVSGLLEGQTGIGEELFRSIDRLKNDADRLRQRMEEEK